MPRKPAPSPATVPAPAIRRVRTVHRKSNPEIQTAETSTNTEEIARLAYSLWEARGCPSGTAEEDWLRAEKILQES